MGTSLGSQHWFSQRLGPRLNEKTVFPGMGFHCKYMTVVRQSFIYNGNSYTGNTTSLYWDSPQVPLGDKPLPDLVLSKIYVYWESEI